MKHLIQGYNNEAWWELNHQPYDRRKNNAPNHSDLCYRPLSEHDRKWRANPPRAN